ncbi:hypothetical protein [Pseudoteredinibacter isoporae]|uniref:Uncharacterized protein n=1 Tax=Pseudoteredinibacter isoporae TaxID=570281 RepID=A0A7X0MXF7_9GAMM|nr:hypothetical protein [Pseudoteredinibacter isoporae]MBB6520877.1 hypothetical protein [Pseudoteredinibacter isoporae]NHO86442.1 hypothetical protein [Pseudoteredinibacter isoporae]NIB25106.1 hypothetical protein [Pseudoteredinibacter isoporae]
MNSAALIKLYYWLSPVFILLYGLTGLDIRVTIPGANPGWHYVYLGVCFLLPSFLIKRPTARSLFALGECSLNIFLLLYGFLNNYFQQLDALSNGLEAPSIASPTDILHFALAAGVLALGFYGNPLVNQKDRG